MFGVAMKSVQAYEEDDGDQRVDLHDEAAAERAAGGGPSLLRLMTDEENKQYARVHGVMRQGDKWPFRPTKTSTKRSGDEDAPIMKRAKLAANNEELIVWKVGPLWKNESGDKPGTISATTANDFKLKGMSFSPEHYTICGEPGMDPQSAKYFVRLGDGGVHHEQPAKVHQAFKSKSSASRTQFDKVDSHTIRYNGNTIKVPYFPEQAWNGKAAKAQTKAAKADAEAEVDAPAKAQTKAAKAVADGPAKAAKAEELSAAAEVPLHKAASDFLAAFKKHAGGAGATDAERVVLRIIEDTALAQKPSMSDSTVFGTLHMSPDAEFCGLVDQLLGDGEKAKLKEFYGIALFVKTLLHAPTPSAPLKKKYPIA